VKRALVEKEHEKLSVRRQCELLSVPRSGVYYVEKPVFSDDLEVMNRIDVIYTRMLNVNYFYRKNDNYSYRFSPFC